MADPVSRLQLAQQEIDRTFGPDYAREHPEVVAVVVQSAASDYAALAIARAAEHRRRPDRARGGGAHRERARAHAGAAVIDVMNSRRFTQSPRRRGRARSAECRGRAL
jgi:hypothetical protein